MRKKIVLFSLLSISVYAYYFLCSPITIAADNDRKITLSDIAPRREIVDNLELISALEANIPVDFYVPTEILDDKMIKELKESYWQEYKPARIRYGANRLHHVVPEYAIKQDTDYYREMLSAQERSEKFEKNARNGISADQYLSEVTAVNPHDLHPRHNGLFPVVDKDEVGYNNETWLWLAARIFIYHRTNLVKSIRQNNKLRSNLIDIFNPIDIFDERGASLNQLINNHQINLIAGREQETFNQDMFQGVIVNSKTGYPSSDFKQYLEHYADLDLAQQKTLDYLSSLIGYSLKKDLVKLNDTLFIAIDFTPLSAHNAYLISFYDGLIKWADRHKDKNVIIIPIYNPFSHDSYKGAFNALLTSYLLSRLDSNNKATKFYAKFSSKDVYSPDMYSIDMVHKMSNIKYNKNFLMQIGNTLISNKKIMLDMSAGSGVDIDARGPILIRPNFRDGIQEHTFNIISGYIHDAYISSVMSNYKYDQATKFLHMLRVISQVYPVHFNLILRIRLKRLIWLCNDPSVTKKFQAQYDNISRKIDSINEEGRLFVKAYLQTLNIDTDMDNIEKEMHKECKKWMGRS